MGFSERLLLHLKADEPLSEEEARRYWRIRLAQLFRWELAYIDDLMENHPADIKDILDVIGVQSQVTKRLNDWFP